MENEKWGLDHNSYVGVKVVFVLVVVQLPHGISGFVGVGEGLLKICFEEIPKLLVGLQDTGIDLSIKEVELILLPWLHHITSHVCESCSDMGVGVGHGLIISIGCFEEFEGNKEA